jgi:ABC-2 type transport system ATP-binding protein
MSKNAEAIIVLESVSKWYGEVLGVNRINLRIPRGITCLVGPNGSGKTTLMNIMTGLIRPSKGKAEILGISVSSPERLFEVVGCCPQYEQLHERLTGYEFLYSMMRIHGRPHVEADRLAGEALERVGMTEARGKKIGAYSRGMRQRIKLAFALSHHPQVLILDEPLNGLDPMARREMIDLFQGLAGAGLTLVVSSHILSEVELLSSVVVMIDQGYIVAEGEVQNVREEIKRHPMQIYIRCDKPSLLCSRLFEMDHIVSVNLDEDRRGVLVRSLDADAFFHMMNRLVLEHDISVEKIQPADDSVQAVYDYLIGNDKEVK